MKLEQNRLALTIKAPRRGVLVVNETYMTGWQATVDGKPASLFQVNYMFRGLILERGEHRVEMAYRPKKVLAGIAVYALTMLGLLVAGAVMVARSRQRRGEDVHPAGG